MAEQNEAGPHGSLYRKLKGGAAATGLAKPVKEIVGFEKREDQGVLATAVYSPFRSAAMLVIKKEWPADGTDGLGWLRYSLAVRGKGWRRS